MEIYSPAEDSFFFSEVLKKEVRKLDINILEMGSGSGIQAQTLIGKGVDPSNLTLVDINKSAISHLNKNFPHCKIVHSDLFNKINESFDLIIFNPPYLPESKYDKEKDTSGGKKGDKTILKFLKQLKKHLKKDGKCFLLLSSLTPTEKIYKEFKKYDVDLIAEKKLFFEKLFIYEIKLRIS